MLLLTPFESFGRSTVAHQAIDKNSDDDASKPSFARSGHYPSCSCSFYLFIFCFAFPFLYEGKALDCAMDWREEKVGVAF